MGEGLDGITIDYHGTILSHDELTWFYKCCIDGQIVQADENGTYFDDEWNPKQVDEWEKIKRAFDEAHMDRKQIQVGTHKKVADTIKSDVKDWEPGTTIPNNIQGNEEVEEEEDDHEWRKRRQRLGYFDD